MAFLLCIFVFSGCSNNSFIAEPTNDSQKEHFFGAGYYKRPDGIYYHDKKLKNADKETFKLLNEPIWSEYATDKNHAYGFGKELKNIDLASFKVLNFRYAQDKNNIYCFGEKLLVKTFQKANPGTFISNPKMDPYAKDKNHAYYNCDVIEGANSKSFTVLASDVAKDDVSVFCGKTKLKNADSESFYVFPLQTGKGTITADYSKDKNNVYYRCKHIVKNADPNSFEIINSYFAKDAKHIFNNGRIAPNNFDVNSFQSLNFSYAKDKNGVYHITEFDEQYTKIENADIDSFEVINEFYAKDKNQVYQGKDILEGIESKGFIQE